MTRKFRAEPMRTGNYSALIRFFYRGAQDSCILCTSLYGKRRLDCEPRGTRRIDAALRGSEGDIRQNLCRGGAFLEAGEEHSKRAP